MVKVTVELSKLEIQMLIYSIDVAIDVKHTKKSERLKEIKNQLTNISKIVVCERKNNLIN